MRPLVKTPHIIEELFHSSLLRRDQDIFKKVVLNILTVMGELSKPPSHKLGGEICIASHMLVYLSLCIYIYMYGLCMA